MYEEPKRPDKSDFYVDLGVAKDANRSQIKKAFRNLAILHHPDKRGPGECDDASEFRRAREAYEILIDDNKKAEYDAEYSGVHSKWTKYHRDLKEWKDHVMREERLRKEAEELARQKDAEEERRKVAREAEQRRNEEAKRAQQATEDYGMRRERFADWAFREAERHKQEAEKHKEEERWAREQEEMEKLRQAAKDQEGKIEKQRKNVEEWAKKKGLGRRLGQQHSARANTTWEHGAWCQCDTCWLDKYRAAAHAEEELERLREENQRRAEEAAELAREEQERQAKERLEKQRSAAIKKQEREQVTQERKKAVRSRTAELKTQATAHKQREEQQKQAQIRLANAHIEKQQQLYLAANSNSVGEVSVTIDIGWVKKKGVAKCLFCNEKIKYYSFHCPEGGAVACNVCKNNKSRYTFPILELEDEDNVLQDLTNIALKDGGGEK